MPSNGSLVRHIIKPIRIKVVVHEAEKVAIGLVENQLFAWGSEN